MVIDAHTPCLACPVQVRNLYAVTSTFVNLLDVGDPNGERLGHAYNALRVAVKELAPFVDAHLENHDHALSPDLADARGPEVPIVPVPTPRFPELLEQLAGARDR